VKKLFLVVVGALALGATPVMAEGDGSGTKYDVHADIFPLFFDILSVGGEAALPLKNFTVVGDLQYSPNFFWVSDVSLFNVSARVRYYYGDQLSFTLPDFLSFLKRSPLAGAFAGVGAGYNSLSENWGGYTWTASSVSFIIETGSKYFFDRHFYAEGLIGLNFQTAPSWTVSGGGNSQTYSGYNYSPSALYSDLSFGYAF